MIPTLPLLLLTLTIISHALPPTHAFTLTSSTQRPIIQTHPRDGLLISETNERKTIGLDFFSTKKSMHPLPEMPATLQAALELSDPELETLKKLGCEIHVTVHEQITKKPESTWRRIQQWWNKHIAVWWTSKPEYVRPKPVSPENGLNRGWFGTFIDNVKAYTFMKKVSPENAMDNLERLYTGKEDIKALGLTFNMNDFEPNVYTVTRAQKIVKKLVEQSSTRTEREKTKITLTFYLDSKNINARWKRQVATLMRDCQSLLYVVDCHGAGCVDTIIKDALTMHNTSFELYLDNMDKRQE